MNQIPNYSIESNLTKDDLDIPDRVISSPIEVGSRVVFVDGSYTLSIQANSYELEQRFVGLCREIYTVVAVNVPVPTINSFFKDSLHPMNNCIVKNMAGDVVFCSHINIRNIKYLGDDKPYRIKTISITPNNGQ